LRLLVDCLPLTKGGGVQAALAFLYHLKDAPDVAWLAVAPTELRPLFAEGAAPDPRLLFLERPSSLARLWLGGAMRAIEARHAPDVVFSVFGPPFYRARAAHVVGFAMPLLVHEPLRGPHAQPLWERVTDPLRIRVFRRADRLVVETQTMRARLSKRLRVDPEKISVIGNCVNPWLLKEAVLPETPTTHFSILIPSAFYRHKNLGIVPRVAEAMRRLDPQLDVEFRLTLDPATPQWRSILSDAVSCGVADRVATLGALTLPALAHAYREASAVFLPTLREASTAVYPESFHFRRPLVTSDMGFAHELCGEAALFAPPLDPTTLAKALIRLGRDPELRGRLVEAGAKRLRSVYPSADEKFALQMELLRSVAAQRKVAGA